MENIFAILIGALFINNFVLSRFLGICPFIGVSKRTGPAFGMGASVTVIMFLASIISYYLYHTILSPFNIAYLDIISFIFVIASLVQIVEILTKKFSPLLYGALGIYLPLITTNCAVLGLAFLNITKDYSIIGTIVHSIGAGLGFTLALVLMSGIRERLDSSTIPKPFQGVPIAFITAALMSLAFMGFSSLVN
jgi:Na+-translocating ferredoxin:NAD+ oxidoreductase subunit A